MKIDSSTIGMESTRTYKSVTQRSRIGVRGTYAGGAGGLNAFFDDKLGTGENAAGEGKTATNLEDLSTHLKNVSGSRQVNQQDDPLETVRSIKQQCVEFLMELLFHFRGERYSLGNGAWSGGMNMYTVNGFQSQYYHMEEENTTFSTVGTVKTADGRELSFNLEMSMSRRFEEYYAQNYVTSVKTFHDPLVINLDTNVAQVSDQKFFFDLDCDGEEEEISSLQAGSGFLALDLNGDGVINDGSELFGPESGNGFADLAKHDADGNGWIDENDPIWEKLLIWTKDEDGKDKLYHLSDLGVGAIGLGNVNTQFALNSQKDNETNAMIRKTGIFLYENGTVSTVQHLDLAR